MSVVKKWNSVQGRMTKHFRRWLPKSIAMQAASITSSRAFLPVIIGVIALNLIWLYWNFSKARTLWETPLANGDKLPEIVGRVHPTGKAVKLPNNSWQLLMYYGQDSAHDTGKAKYVDLLVNKYGRRNFSAVGIITGHCQRLKALAAQHELSYPFILDEKQRIARLLGLGNHMHATFVADPNGIIRFAATTPYVIEEEDLRQLV
ncbi:MAG: redoxin domain-containing protein [candidate division WOR-3 bacterium]